MGIDLTKYENDFMEPGQYEVEVVDAEEGRQKRGKRESYIRLKLENDEGEICYESFLLTKTAFIRLISFAKACRLTREERSNVTGESFIGRRLMVTVEENEKGYPEVTHWEALQEEEEAP